MTKTWEGLSKGDSKDKKNVGMIKQEFSVGKFDAVVHCFITAGCKVIVESTHKSLFAKQQSYMITRIWWDQDWFLPVALRKKKTY